MQAPTQELEWYFSNGLINIIVEGNIIKIEHEDGLYWVEIAYNKEVLEFLEEFMR
ncbi:hypothetical protein JCM14244_03920 [Venenivibrio stagnispumantis]|uniref:Uncharacterized protein n=1 Tax=Venenivibrio stagnispumantis TaxID=407998 RepID=A0AA45WK01_9AQUI|nr:hypothetical protein [Venenivibrio stagnispumantis]MCW4572969.1 hypothetical protein [Venenivibrio stagnispumantis]SMP05320.1 hypothetical protein SAMN06264868_10370 [Venenivibrio stagnispumantis]